MNDGDSSEGSESAPSEDNLSDDEMFKIMPFSLRNKMKKSKWSVIDALKWRKEEKLRE